MELLKKLYVTLCRWFSTPDLDWERFEQLERKKYEGKNEFK